MTTKFDPPHAEQQIKDALGTQYRLIVVFGDSRATQPLVDWFKEQPCGVHTLSDWPCGVYTLSDWPDPLSFVSMVKNLRATKDGAAVLFITNPKASLPPRVRELADLVLFGMRDGTQQLVMVNKDRWRQLAPDFSCTPAPEVDPSDRDVTADVKDFWVRGTATGRFSSAAPNVGVIAPMTPKDLTLTGPDGREFIRVTPDGEAFVRGEKVAASQHDVYEMFRAWLMKAQPKPTVGFPLPPEALADLERMEPGKVYVGNPKFVPLVPVDTEKQEIKVAYKVLSDAAARLVTVLNKTRTEEQADAIDEFMLQLRTLGIDTNK